MNKIRVIDLLNKIAKGEEVPKFKLKGHNAIWEYKYEFEQFLWGTLNLDVLHCLNSEIEIIEDEEPDLFEIIEEKPKHIEEVKEIVKLQDLEPPYGNNESMFMKRIIMQQNKIDEITKAVNYLLNKEQNNE